MGDHAIGVVTVAAVGPRSVSKAEGILVVVPPPTGARPHASPAGVLLGLPLIRRIVLAATTAGYERVLVTDAESAARRLLEGTGATALSATGAVPPLTRRRIVALPANVVPQPQWLRALLDVPIEPDTLHVDPSLTVLVETADPGPIVGAAARSTSAEGLVAELRRTFREAAWPLDSLGRFPIAVPGDIPKAESWLLRSLIKQREGFMSRHVERRISLALTRRLVATSATPNMMTLMSLAIGLAGAPCFLSSSPAWQLAGALLFLTHSILDGCDGELARLKFLQSRLGAVLDYWGDNVVHVAVFACIAVGWSLRVGGVWPLVLGVVAVVATLGTATLFFERISEDRVAAAGGSWAGRLAGALASRDFIYVVVLLAAFGKVEWFLIAAAVGTPAFLFFALWLDRHDGRLR